MILRIMASRGTYGGLQQIEKVPDISKSKQAPRAITVKAFSKPDSDM